MASLALSLRINQFHWMGIVELVQYIPLSFLGYKYWELRESKKKAIV